MIAQKVLSNRNSFVCYTEPSEKSPLVWKRAGTFKKKKYLAGDLMNHLSITVSPCEAAGFARSRDNTRIFTLIGPTQVHDLKPDEMDLVKS